MQRFTRVMAALLLSTGSACQNQATTAHEDAARGAERKALPDTRRSTTPAEEPADWSFGLRGSFGTGLALADLNRDGFKDIVVSNGNDMYPQPITIHFYHPNLHKFQELPEWLSDDYDYHIGLCMGDVDRDGNEDLAVAMPWNKLRDPDSGGVKLYLGTGDGLSPSPSKRIEGRYAAMACAFGDVDVDGDLDLMVATIAGRQQNPIASPVHIYENRNGALDDERPWRSKALRAGDLVVADVDADGWLDLVVAADKLSIFHGNRMSQAHDNGASPSRFFAETPWEAAEERCGLSYGLDVARLDGQSDMTVVTSSMTYSGDCTSSYGVYRPAASATAIKLHHEAENRTHAFGKVYIMDRDANDVPDLLLGQWKWDPVRGVAGAPLLAWSFEASRTQSQPDILRMQNALSLPDGFIPQDIIASDVHRHCIQNKTEDYEIAERRAVLTLPENHVERIVSVSVDGCEVCTATVGQSLQPVQNAAGVTHACNTVPGANWVSFSPPLEKGQSVTISYETSKKLELVIANWSSSGKNIIKKAPYYFGPECGEGKPPQDAQVGGRQVPCTSKQRR